MAKLKLEIRENAFEIFEIKNRLSLGREVKNDVILLDGIVSRTHAQVYRDEEFFVIEDLNSANGIYINGEKILLRSLEEGDIIQIGKTTLSFSLDKTDEPKMLVDLINSSLEKYDHKSIVEAPDLHFRFPSKTEIMEQVYEIAQEKFKLLEGLSSIEKGKLFNILHEAIGNAQRHGHKNKSYLPIEFRYTAQKDKLIMEVTDQGEGFNYRAQLRGKEGVTAIEAARKRYLEGGYGGLGIILMLACVDELEYNSVGNQITLVKNLNSTKPPLSPETQSTHPSALPQACDKI